MRAITEKGVSAKINLGCGNDVKPGYVNVDFRQTHPNVIIADLSQYPWPFESESASEILMYDFLEHFPYNATRTILLECYRILQPDGEVVIQVPDAVQTARALIQEGMYLCNMCGSSMYQFAAPHMASANLNECAHCGISADEISHAAVKRFYGGQDYPGNFHQTVFSERSLTLQAAKAGLVAPVFEEKNHMWINWTIKCRFKKGDLW